MHWPSSELPHFLLASVSIGPSDAYDFTELSTEYIYALDLDNLSGNPATSLDLCLECLPRFAPSDDNSTIVSFVRVSLADSFLT